MARPYRYGNMPYNRLSCSLYAVPYEKASSGYNAYDSNAPYVDEFSAENLRMDDSFRQ